MDILDVVVVGAGVVGLAIALQLQEMGRSVVLLEKNGRYGLETSARSSEVIHAGIYYPTGSLKAKLCVEGRNLLYAFCKKHQIPHRQVGKLILAIESSDSVRLQRYKEHAESNGVHDLRWLTPQEVQQLEPQLKPSMGLYSPSTGILDSHCLMQTLVHQFESCGGLYLPHHHVSHIIPDDRGFHINIADVGSVVTRKLINSAGHGAVPLAHHIDGLPKQCIPEHYYCKGYYFLLRYPSPFQRLIYPLPVAGGLGIHVTLDLAGNAKFGPDVEWISNQNYQFNELRKDQFLHAIKSYFPTVNKNDLVPGYTGIRPKIVGPNQPDADFRIDHSGFHHIPGLINLFGIESPGLTSALAIASYVAALVET